MRYPISISIFLSALLLIAGCNRPAKPTLPAEDTHVADISILFVGNSHTGMHDIPNLVRELIRQLRPGKSVFAYHVSVAFLEDATSSPLYREQIKSRAWTHVVLQGQKISASGKHEYSREAGIEMARYAKERGSTVFYYPEWGLKGVAGDGARQEKIYREMARDAGVDVAPVAKAWDLALADRPELELYSADRNHQSELGAFLTASVIAGKLTGESPAPLAGYPYRGANEADRKYLAGIAAKALAE
jgi:hypothetical protein